ncbi:MAG: SDR family NAD(P)-dependent oxidoreductase [Planctomycetes bacterium]|nr:SDR family NAD(P)-dependent oxidoreductase [Planctomycetota bacterium]
MSRHVVITGASSGIGAACARAFAKKGDTLSLGARRQERLASIAPGAFCHALDVTDPGSVERFLAAAIAAHGPIDVLVNNAGLARGVEKIAEGTGEAWREMIETNVLGLLEVTRRVLPQMMARKHGHVVVIGSIAGHKAYPGGGVYCGSKRALQPICEAMRMETLGTGVRVTSVDPGLVETEFSLVRFRGDAERAAKVYTDMRPLTGDDVAECVLFAVDRPAHVNLDTIVVMPTDQATPQMVHRGGR